MRSTLVSFVSMLLLTCSQLWALEMPKVPDIGDMTKGSLLDKVNKSLADQQNKDGQFASGNAKRISGLLKVLSTYSKSLSAIPNLHVGAEGHTDAAGTPESNQKLSVARANTVCAALKEKGMKLPCTASGVGSSKPLVSPEKT